MSTPSSPDCVEREPSVPESPNTSKIEHIGDVSADSLKGTDGQATCPQDAEDEDSELHTPDVSELELPPASLDEILCPGSGLAPPPVSVSDLDSKHPLWCQWSLWYDGLSKRSTLKNWSDNVKAVASFRTAEDFFSLHNNIRPPSELLHGANYHLFKFGVKPMWEHEVNKRGGKWVIVLPRNVPRSTLDQCWLYLCLALIGETLPDGDEVCGGVVSVRKNGDRLSLWTRTASKKETVIAIGQALRNVLKDQIAVPLKFSYQAHSDSLQNDTSFGNRSLYNI